MRRRRAPRRNMFGRSGLCAIGFVFSRRPNEPNAPEQAQRTQTSRQLPDEPNGPGKSPRGYSLGAGAGGGSGAGSTSGWACASCSTFFFSASRAALRAASVRSCAFLIALSASWGVRG